MIKKWKGQTFLMRRSKNLKVSNSCFLHEVGRNCFIHLEEERQPPNLLCGMKQTTKLTQLFIWTIDTLLDSCWFIDTPAPTPQQIYHLEMRERYQFTEASWENIANKRKTVDAWNKMLLIVLISQCLKIYFSMYLVPGTKGAEFDWHTSESEPSNNMACFEQQPHWVCAQQHLCKPQCLPQVDFESQPNNKNRKKLISRFVKVKNEITACHSYAVISTYHPSNKDMSTNVLLILGLKSVDKILLAYNLIESIHEHAFARLPKLERLSLEYNKLSCVSRFFSSLDGVANQESNYKYHQVLYVLYLSHNDIVTIYQQAFTTLGGLRCLYLEHNHLTSLNSSHFESLSCLRQLFLSNNEITEFERNTFAPLVALRNFYIRHNKLTSIPDHMFAPLVSLRQLYLDNNRISSIHQHAFASLEKLKFLSLQYSKICCINSNLFATLTNIQYLYLQHNEITTVHGCAFATQAQLRMLSLDHNNISTKLTNLTIFYFYGKLDLSNNGITHIPEHAFTTLRTLVTLHLDHNKIRWINSKHFRSLTNLITLSLMHNEIATIHHDAFASLGQLQHLYLDNNKVIHSNASHFETLNNLQNFSFEHNEITVVSKHTFASLKELKQLLLCCNKINWLMSQAFFGLSILRELGLSHNFIAQLSEKPFLDLVNLEILRLDSNRISHLKFDTFQGLVTLVSLNLSSNKISHIVPGTFHFWLQFCNFEAGVQQLSQLSQKLQFSEFNLDHRKEILLLDLHESSFTLHWKMFVNPNYDFNNSDNFVKLPSQFLKIDEKYLNSTCGRHLCWLQQIHWEIFYKTIPSKSCETYLQTTCPSKGNLTFFFHFVWTNSSFCDTKIWLTFVNDTKTMLNFLFLSSLAQNTVSIFQTDVWSIICTCATQLVKSHSYSWLSCILMGKFVHFNIFANAHVHILICLHVCSPVHTAKKFPWMTPWTNMAAESAHAPHW